MAGGVAFVAPLGAGASWFTWVDSPLGAAAPVGAGAAPMVFVAGAVVVPGPWKVGREAPLFSEPLSGSEEQAAAARDKKRKAPERRG